MKQNKLSLIAASFLTSAALLSGQAAWAHGAAEPQHGGIVQTAADLSFELVTAATGAVVYVTDHDEPFDASKLSGKLTVLDGEAKSEANLEATGGNKLEAKGLKLNKGAKVVASLKTAGRKTITVRFTVK
ncbi:hypothetical protein [Rhizobacter sp. Root1221]|uniref:hypothetical protein n=1 Tax=Rhizobacter sp. Root1221 TaxID=1736433 RepID=UPI0006F4073F|nr:hypothetical protein [Rhizobacter sp. Root1221]KQW02916.1 hypothetical protein ASC87_00770 [Rhizobacter sp. Root1221]